MLIFGQTFFSHTFYFGSHIFVAGSPLPFDMIRALKDIFPGVNALLFLISQLVQR